MSYCLEHPPGSVSATGSAIGIGGISIIGVAVADDRVDAVGVPGFGLTSGSAY